MPHAVVPASASPMRLLDTDVVIDVQRKNDAAAQWFAAQDLSTIAIPGYVALELLQNARHKKEAEASNGLLRLLTRVWPSPLACETALDDFYALHLSHGLGLVDALIGATAREHKAILCTFNHKHYRTVPDLAIEQPYTR